MRNRLWVAALALLLTGYAAHAQETRGSISGTVQDNDGVLPGASVKIVNVATGVAQTVITNSGGYFEAPLLLAGNYEITVEMAGFKTLKRAGITLSGAQQLTLPLTLEVGSFSETITVSDAPPLLETNTTRVGTNFTERQLQELPFISNMPVMLARFAPGLNASSIVQWAGQGAIGDPSSSAQPLGGVGGNEYTIDGATNNGTNRFYATSPNTDMLQEMRVESTSFSATTGHGTGLGISMTTRAGTNSFSGITNYQYWTNRLNAPNPFQQAVLDADPLAMAAYRQGYSHNISQTFGGPIRRDRLFAFLNYSHSTDNFNGKNASRRTVPTSAKQLDGDFSDLLLLPNGDAVPDLRSAHHAARSGASWPRHPRSVPRKHRAQRSRDEPALHALCGPAASSQCRPGTGSRTRQQSLQRRRADAAQKPRVGRPCRFQSLRARPLLRQT